MTYILKYIMYYNIMNNLLLIDSRIKDINTLIDSLNLNTFYIILDFFNDTINSLLNKIDNLHIININNIGLIKEEEYDKYYKLVKNQNNCILMNVITEDPELESWYDITYFFKYLKNKYNFNEFDYISCNLAKYDDYLYIFNYYSKLFNIVINASDKYIGNINNGGSWIIKGYSNLYFKQACFYKDIKNTYFTDKILEYIYLFGIQTTISIILENNIITYGDDLVVSLTLDGDDVTTSDNGTLYLIDNLGTTYLSVTTNNIPPIVRIPNISIDVTILIGNFIPISSILYNSSIKTVTLIVHEKEIYPIFTVNKYYDKTTTAYYTYTLSGICNYDISYVNLSPDFTISYRNSNAELNTYVDISNISLTGNKSINYKIINSFTAIGNIYKLPVKLYGVQKIVDDNNQANINIFGQLPSDSIIITSYIAYYSNNSYGNQLINYYNLTLSGSCLNNYALPPTNGTTYGLILQVPTYYNMISKQNTNYTQRVWSLGGFNGACYTSFNMDNQIYVGLSEQNNNSSKNYFGYYFYIDISDNVYIAETNNINNSLALTSYGKNTNSLFSIYYDGSNINYYQDSVLLKTTTRNKRVNLYFNLLFGFVDQLVTNICFIPIKEYYYGGNGIIVQGFKGNDTIKNLSGELVYSGASQGAHNAGRYPIIVSGYTSNNYNIIYINGFLNIRISLYK